MYQNVAPGVPQDDSFMLRETLHKAQVTRMRRREGCIFQALFYTLGFLSDIPFVILFWEFPITFFRSLGYYALHITSVPPQLVLLLLVFVPFIAVFSLQFLFRAYCTKIPFLSSGLRAAIFCSFCFTLIRDAGSRIAFDIIGTVLVAIEADLRTSGAEWLYWFRNRSSKKHDRMSAFPKRYVAAHIVGILALCVIRFVSWGVFPAYELYTMAYSAGLLVAFLALALAYSVFEDSLWLVWPSRIPAEAQKKLVCVGKQHVHEEEEQPRCCGILKKRDRSSLPACKDCCSCWCTLVYFQSIVSLIMWSCGFGAIMSFVGRFIVAPHSLGDWCGMDFDYAPIVVAAVAAGIIASHFRFFLSPVILFVIQVPTLAVATWANVSILAFVFGVVFVASLPPMLRVYLDEYRHIKGFLSGGIAFALIVSCFVISLTAEAAYNYTYFPGLGHLYGGSVWAIVVWYYVLVAVSLGSFVLNRLALFVVMIREMPPRLACCRFLLMIFHPLYFVEIAGEKLVSTIDYSRFFLGMRRKDAGVVGDGSESLRQEEENAVIVLGEVDLAENSAVLGGEGEGEGGGGEDGTDDSSEEQEEEEQELAEFSPLLPSEALKTSDSKEDKPTTLAGLFSTSHRPILLCVTSALVIFGALIVAVSFLVTIPQIDIQPYHTDRLRVATSNVYMGYTMHGEINMPYVADFLKRQQVDLVGFQEAGTVRSMMGYHQFGDYVGKKAGLHMARANWGRRSTFDVAVGSRCPIIESEGHVFRLHEGMLLRPFIYCRILVNKTQISFFDLHLDLETASSADEVDELLQFIASRKITGPIIIVGDFNLQPNTTAVVKVREAGYTDAYFNATGRHDWTSGDPTIEEKSEVECIDYVFVSSHFEVIQAGLGKREDGIRFSDHYAVWVDVRLK